MDRTFCDLHTHSTFSDGTDTPEELVARAKEIGLSAVALTDHNTARGLARFMEAGKAAGQPVIAGAEFSTDYGAHEVHMLALFLSPESYGAVDEFAAPLWKNKEISNRNLTAALADAGYPLDYEAIRASRPGGQVNRSVIADAMQEKGYMRKDEAFRTVLSEHGGLFVPPKRLDVFETIRFIRSVGAVPVLAHAFLNFRGKGTKELEQFLKEAKAAGLGGMEIMYSEFTTGQQKTAEELAQRFGLAKSGGSDYHGTAKPGIALGTGRGNLAVPAEYVAALRAA